MPPKRKAAAALSRMRPSSASSRSGAAAGLRRAGRPSHNRGRSSQAPAADRRQQRRSGAREDEEEEDEHEGPDSEEELEKAGDAGARRSPSSPPLSAAPSAGFDEETADERRVRLTKAYLHHLAQQRGGGRGKPVADGEREEDDGAAAGSGDGALSSDDDEEEMEDVVGHRLLLDADAHAGRRLHRPYAALYRRVGGLLDTAQPAPAFRLHRGHRLSVTCTALAADERVVYSAAKDGSLIEWDVESGRRLSCWTHRQAAAQETGVQQQHTATPTARPPPPPSARSAAASDVRGKGDVLGLAVSSDGRFLASGGVDGCIHVWDTRQRGAGLSSSAPKGEAAEEEEAASTASPPAARMHTSAPPLASTASPRGAPPLWCSFSAHRSAVSCLAFPSLLSSSSSSSSSCHLFSGSHDRTVKLFDVDSRNYVETLFGHTQAVQALHSYDAQRQLHSRRAVSVGADRTARMWKVVEESQLLFRMEPALSAGVASAMAASAPLSSLDCVVLLDDERFLTGGDDGQLALWSAHKKRPLHRLPAAHGPQRWLIALAAAPHADVAYSGSSDGHVNVYQLSAPQQQRGGAARGGSAASSPSNPTQLSSSSSAATPAASAALSLVRRVPLLGYVNSLSCAQSGRFLVAGVGQEHRAGRWTERIAAAKNGIAILPLLPSST